MLFFTCLLTEKLLTEKPTYSGKSTEKLILQPTEESTAKTDEEGTTEGEISKVNQSFSFFEFHWRSVVIQNCSVIAKPFREKPNFLTSFL